MLNPPKFSELFNDDIADLSIESKTGEGCYIRLEKETDGPIDIIKLITSYDIPELLYFRDKKSLNQFGGLGSTLVIKADSPDDAFPTINEILSLDKNIRLFGGFSFSNYTDLSDEWKGFNNCRFTLPLIEIHRRKDKYFYVVNYFNSNASDAGEIKKELIEKLVKIDAGYQGSVKEHKFSMEREELIPEKPEWIEMINSALEKIRNDVIEKVVLTRKKVIRNKNYWNMFNILNKLNKLKEESFLFFYKIDNNLAFIGRSPERLLKLKKQELIVESIAGTRPRGDSRDEDRLLEDELLNSPKELEEHRIVSQFIRERMDNFCRNVEVIENEVILKLQNLQHIMTVYSGPARDDIYFLELLNSFHPTPAVGGNPKEIVHQIIPELEPFQRGWYSGPIGWVRMGEGNFAVGIRSALIHGKDLHIFAGSGIVRQSDPVEEWNETDNKMDNFLKGLGEL